MPRKTMRKFTRKLPKVHEMIDTKTEDLMPVPQPARRFPLTKIALIIVVLGLVAIFVSNKGLLVAAVVNGRPIFRWQLNSVMTSRYGQQTLDSMISQTLIDEEAGKAGISVAATDIAKKESDLVKSLGGNVSIDDVLKYQGMTKADFEDQLRLQLTVEKLLGKDITITDADVDAYIATNQATLTATDEAGLKEEAKQAIFSQQINDKLQTWFSEVKTKAKILRFL
ncbi:MAG: SurA N-terminal domain-containing protein [Candidatus Gottesmanbacteria bacterium]|nr:SurA N-terminal domain-containing protein [Candidatus Gottesmanbacteria bacterium]